MSTTIICPNCKTEFEPQAAIEEEISKAYHEKLNTEKQRLHHVQPIQQGANRRRQTDEAGGDFSARVQLRELLRDAMGRRGGRELVDELALGRRERANFAGHDFVQIVQPVHRGGAILGIDIVQRPPVVL